MMMIALALYTWDQREGPAQGEGLEGGRPTGTVGGGRGGH